MSQLFVDQIEPKTSGGSTSINTGTGQVLEILTSNCTGETINGVTFENVTDYSLTSTTRAPYTGSTVTYTPPTGTTRVIYQFQFAYGYEANHTLIHNSLFIDDVEVTDSRFSYGQNSVDYGQRTNFEYTIVCNASSNNAARGEFTSWTSNKTITLKNREYGSTYGCEIHAGLYWDGATSRQFCRPRIALTAIR